MPAAMEMIRWLRVMCVAIPRRTVETTSGFTAMMMTWACCWEAVR